MVLIHFVGVGTKKSQNTQAKTGKGSCKGCWRAWEMWWVPYYCEYANVLIYVLWMPFLYWLLCRWST